MGKRILGKGNSSSKSRVAGKCTVVLGSKKGPEGWSRVCGGEERALWLKEAAEDGS